MTGAYEKIKVIDERATLTLWRARRLSDARRVLLKTVKQADHDAAEALRNEAEILSRLTGEHIVDLLGFDEDAAEPQLILDDPGGVLLADAFADGPATIDLLLRVALQAVAALDSVHAAGIVHGDINPHHFLYHPDRRQLTLLDFMTATVVSKATQACAAAHRFSASLPYISPEQTGRMNRSVDQRTDFYSLGVMLYRLATGQLPFVSADPLEIVHAHLALEPPDPSTLNAAIPPMIARLIGKLLRKTPAERYQSAAGLRHDLQRCASEWLDRQAIDDFTLGLGDSSTKIRLPEQLYGRRDDIATLLATFERVAEGARTLLVVSGPSGVGKSSLVREMHRPISERHGLFLEGKFEQYRRDIPFSGWIQALDGFVGRLLRYPENELAPWRQTLRAALSANGRVMTDLLPHLELVVGAQPPLPDLNGQEAVNRFTYVLRRFIGALAHPRHPLVVFLDDLHWIDAASLDLLKSLLSDPTLSHALFVGAYRSNEVGPASPLAMAIAELDGTPQLVRRLFVRNLERDEVEALIGDALGGTTPDNRPLAAVVHAKTAGNPFFVHQLLGLLEKGDYWDFDTSRGAWRLNTARIDALEITDNVVDLLVEKIRCYLPADLSQLLAFAACVGSRIDPTTLGQLLGQDPADLRQRLRQAVHDGWLNEHAGDYGFAHDRIQQAFYSLTPEPRRQQYHLQIARALTAAGETADDRLFDAANQIGHCLSLVDQIIEATIRHWQEHASGTLAPLELGYRCGLESGDLEYATYCAEFEAMHRFLLGQPLQELRPKVDAYAQVIARIGQVVALNHHRLVQQAVHNLLGETADPVVLQGSAFDESRELATLVDYNDRLCLLIFYFQKVLLAVVFRQSRPAGALASVGADYADGAPGCFVLPFFLAYELLALLAARRLDPSFIDPRIDRLIADFTQRLSAAAQQAPMNYRHLLDLVSAESAAWDGRHDEAATFYEAAIAGAAAGRYLREEALACELAAEFYYRRALRRIGDLYIGQAHAAYCRWQAWAKSEQLAARHPFLTGHPDEPSDKRPTLAALDLQTVLKASQALYRAMELPELLRRMMTLIVENSGAQQAYLIVERDGDWVVDAAMEAGAGHIALGRSAELAASGRVSTDIVRYVARTQDMVIVDDAAHEGAFCDDPVIRQWQAKSLLCLPFINLGRVNGVLYLENKLVSGAFSADRVPLLEVLCAQAAIALDNSRLYDELEQRVASRTEELVHANREAQHAMVLAEARASELRRQATFIQTILENIADGIVACDENGRLTLFNRATREMHGVDRADLPPDRWAECYDLYLADGQTRMATTDIPLYRALLGERLRNVEMVIAPRHGEAHIVLASAQPMIDANGDRIGAVVSMHDVSEQKRAQEQLQQAKDAAESANRAKSVFLANMSHELRTPLNAVLGFSELLLRDAQAGREQLSAGQMEHLATIRRSGEHLLMLINNVLELSRIEAGRSVTTLVNFDLHDLLAGLQGMFALKATRQGLRFAVVHSPATPRYVVTDEVKLRQVLINLIGNAFKFTERGAIRVDVDVTLPDARGTARRLCCAVSDTGAGIAAADLERLYVPFAQFAAGRRAPEGTGLGLAISRQFVELLGGRISAQSTVGAGSVFRFEIPVRVAAPPAPAAAADNLPVLGLLPGETRYRILVVDNDADNRRLLARLLVPLGFEIREAEDGQQAIAVWQEWRPQLIWMDIRMPGMDGREATQRIKSLPHGQETRIIALTASSFEEERAEIVAAGCDDFLRKPFHEPDLLAMIERHLEVRYRRGEDATTVAAPVLTTEEMATALRAIPGETLRQLEEAAIRGDMVAIADSVDVVHVAHPALAAALRRLTDDFDYGSVASLAAQALATATTHEEN